MGQHWRPPALDVEARPGVDCGFIPQPCKRAVYQRAEGRKGCLADTTTAHGKLVVTIPGGLAEFERHLILSRTVEARQRARARGVKSSDPRNTARGRHVASIRLPTR